MYLIKYLRVLIGLAADKDTIENAFVRPVIMYMFVVTFMLQLFVRCIPRSFPRDILVAV